MKSVFLTLLIFAIVSAILYSGILTVISTKGFFYTSISFFVIVILCAIIFVGLPQQQKNNSHREKIKNQKTITRKTNRTNKKGKNNENN